MRWTVRGDDNAVVVVETFELPARGQRIAVHVPSGRPVWMGPETAQRLRHIVGAAIGDVLRGERW